MATFVCDGCGNEFQIVDGWDAEAEAAAAFPEGLAAEQRSQVCEDCWTAMRDAFPTLAARYKLAGL
jgi:hypothetical protein